VIAFSKRVDGKKMRGRSPRKFTTGNPGQFTAKICLKSDVGVAATARR
jgi:hypothetical protein